MITRRDASRLFFAAAAQAAAREDRLLHELHLSPSDLDQLAPGGERAVRDALILADLPLDGVAPGFVFVPYGG